MNATTTAALRTREELARLAQGGDPDGADLAAFGPYADVIQEAYAAHAEDGPAGVVAYLQTPQVVPIMARDPNESIPVFSNWRPKRLGEITKPEPRKAVVQGLLYRKTLSLCFGAPGAIKSFVLADLALCVAAGKPWLLPDPGDPAAAACCEFKTERGPVYWIDFDNGEYTSEERFFALKAAHHVDDAPFYLLSMPDPWLDLSQPNHAAAFTDWLGALPEPPALVVIDNLACISGGIPDNDSMMKNVMAALRRAAEATGAHIAVIHHERKSNGLNARAGENIRGSSTIEAALDLALLFQRPDPSRPIVTIKATKNRILRSVPNVGVMLKSESGADDVMTGARCWQVPIDSDPQEDQARDALNDILSNGPVSKTELAKKATACCGMGVNKMRGFIDSLVGNGDLLAEETRTGKPIMISLPTLANDKP